jgi:hypothetical protein
MCLILGEAEAEPEGSDSKTHANTSVNKRVLKPSVVRI